LAYFQGVPEFGDVLAKKLLSIIFLTFFSVLIFSNIVTALSSFFLSKDLMLIHSMPLTLKHIYFSRLTETTISSSWMLLFFSLPVWIVYGIIYHATASYYGALVSIQLPFMIMCGATGVIVTLMLVCILPAQRTRDILWLFSILLITILYILFRFSRPERLVYPDAFATVVNYFDALRAPDSSYLPSIWATESLWSLLHAKGKDSLFFQGLLWSNALFLSVIGACISDCIYYHGYSKAQEAKRRPVSKFFLLDSLAAIWAAPFKSSTKSIITKDIKTFFRDNAQWSQVFLLMALIVVYLYNFKALPLDRAPLPTFYLQNAVSFLNIALAGFVIAAVAARFVFPAVSIEGLSFWIIKSSPISLKRLLWSKFWTYLLPLLLLSEVLIIASNYLLQVTPFMMILSSVTVFFMVFGITTIGVGMGATYPDFRTENISHISTGFHGLLYMMLCVGFIGLVIILEAFPTYTVFISRINHTPLGPFQYFWIVLCFSAVLVVNVLAVWLPMKRGLKELSEMDV
jgi:ABC-2 type transport system permease protein